MSDVSVTIHGLLDMISGKTDFAGFRDGEVAMLKRNIAGLPAAVQPFVQIGVNSLEAGASELVGIGQTAAGPILAESSDEQATLVLNLLQKLGVPTGGVALTIPEHVVLTTAISGLKTMLDRMGLHIATMGQAPAPVVAPVAQAA